MSQLNVLCPISEAIRQLSEVIRRVDVERVQLAKTSGRILAEGLIADRDSPASDVSAMDGFAIAMEDLSKQNHFDIDGQAAAGEPPRVLPTGKARKIFTGAPIPVSANLVIERERAEELDGTVRFTIPASDLKLGRNIRFKGENIAKGGEVLKKGTLLSPSQVAAMSTFAPLEVLLYRKLRVSVLNTGSEIKAPGSAVESWQIRDSNGPFLEAALQRWEYVELVRRQSVVDEKQVLKQSIQDALASSDVVLMTGGVSAGDYDYVPEVLDSLGVQMIFHRLPQKPGRPVFGGVGPDRQLVCGLPGNPVSVAVTARRIAFPVMRYMAGCDAKCLNAWPIRVSLSGAAVQSPLVMYLLAKRDSQGLIMLDGSKGSGDVVALGSSDGFVEFNPFVSKENHETCFYSWDM